MLEAILSPSAHIAFSGGPIKAMLFLCRSSGSLGFSEACPQPAHTPWNKHLTSYWRENIKLYFIAVLYEAVFYLTLFCMVWFLSPPSSSYTDFLSALLLCLLDLLFRAPLKTCAHALWTKIVISSTAQPMVQLTTGVPDKLRNISKNSLTILVYFKGVKIQGPFSIFRH